MRGIALALALSCCASVRPAIHSSQPSSLPLLRVDGELSGPRISVEGMRIVLKKRDELAARCDKDAEDLTAALHGEAMRREAAEKAAARNAWWGIYGLPAAIGAGVGGALVTAAIFILVLIKGGK